jgi:hypothetical protein
VKLILASAIVASWQFYTDTVTVLSSASDRRLPPIPSPVILKDSRGGMTTDITTSTSIQNSHGQTRKMQLKAIHAAVALLKDIWPR